MILLFAASFGIFLLQRTKSTFYNVIVKTAGTHLIFLAAINSIVGMPLTALHDPAVEYGALALYFISMIVLAAILVFIVFLQERKTGGSEEEESK